MIKWSAPWDQSVPPDSIQLRSLAPFVHSQNGRREPNDRGIVQTKNWEQARNDDDPFASDPLTDPSFQHLPLWA